MNSEEEKKEVESSLHSDKPIESEAQDKLGRAKFIEILSEHILHANQKEPLLIALNAPWGAGKTSFLNMLEQKLKVAKDSKDKAPIIVRFNPWLYSSVEQLVEMFFAELAQGIGKSPQQWITEQVKDYLPMLGRFLLIGLSGAASVASAAYFSGMGDSMAPAASAGVGALLNKAGEKLDPNPKDKKTLTELKNELNDLLLKLNQRIIIFIDDIDRLERETMRYLFRMIRLNADFPNVTYILAFDRFVVEKNLDEENGIRGRDYLEKIVQVSFDIPEPEPLTLHRILRAEINAALGSLKIQQVAKWQWDWDFDLEKTWEYSVYPGFEEHFRTIRQIKRYVNGLRFSWAPIVGEVDIADFLAVELLRVFHPDVYRKVAAEKELLTERPISRDEDAFNNSREDFIEALCKEARPENIQKHLKNLLDELFPSDNVESFRYYSGIRSPDNFDKFFLLAMPKGETSRLEIREFLKAIEDRNTERIKHCLEQAIEAGNSESLVQHLDYYTSRLLEEPNKWLVSVLFAEDNSVGSDIFAQIIFQCLERLIDSEKRRNLILSCMNNNVSLYTILFVTKHSDPKKFNTNIFTDYQEWTPLRDAVIKHIENTRADKTLWDSSRLPDVLSLWEYLEDKETVQLAVSEYVQDDEKLISFLESSFGFYTARRDPGYDFKGKLENLLIKSSITDFFSSLLNIETTIIRLRSLSQGENELAEKARELIALMEQVPNWSWSEKMISQFA
ncbi:MAG: hypothetical protein LBM75_08290 [Myxococcales bacterium]|jgi:predicted KAP-like P-loop ATPase|nr:hypothetical protein [Myxococcales bacterium]